MFVASSSGQPQGAGGSQRRMSHVDRQRAATKETASQTDRQTDSRTDRQTARQPDSQTANQPASQPASQQASQPASQPARQTDKRARIQTTLRDLIWQRAFHRKPPPSSTLGDSQRGDRARPLGSRAGAQLLEGPSPLLRTMCGVVLRSSSGSF